ncbi:MAG: stalk domain-containing protein [Aminipila sp.]
MKKKLLSFFTVAALLVASTTITFAGNIGIDINGTKVSFTDNTGAPFVDSANRTQVPLRVTMEKYGCQVAWDQTAQIATVTKDNNKVEIPIGQKYIVVNGNKQAIDTAAQVVNNRTYLPIRAVLEAFGANISWNQATQTVEVKNASGQVKTEIATLPEVKVHFIDVGQGDSIFIDAGEFEILIDAGPKSAGQKVANYIKPYVDGELDLVVATHEHEDHIGGLPAVLAAYTVGTIEDNGRTADTSIYKEYINAVNNQIKNNHTFHFTLKELNNMGTQINAENTLNYKVLQMQGQYSDPNNNSLVSMLTYKDVNILFMGDAEQEVEKSNLSTFKDVDVLKAGHHGSDTASSTEFLKVTKPETVIVSCATGNTYKHPHLAALQRFSGLNAKVYGTEKSGNIVLTTNGSTYSLNTSTQLTTADAGDNTSNIQSMAPATDSQVNNTTTSVTQAEATYVGNSSTKKYHKLDCRYANSIKAENVVYFKTKTDATTAGFEPCKVCNP